MKVSFHHHTIEQQIDLLNKAQSLCTKISTYLSEAEIENIQATKIDFLVQKLIRTMQIIDASHRTLDPSIYKQYGDYTQKLNKSYTSLLSLIRKKHSQLVSRIHWQGYFRQTLFS